MANIAGRFQTISIDAVAVGDVTDGAMSGENAEIDTTTHDDAGSRTFIYGRFSGSMDLTMLWNNTDAGQEDVLDAFFGKTTNAYVFLLETLSGADRYTAQGLVTAVNPTASNDDATEWTATIRITGDLVRDNQP